MILKRLLRYYHVELVLAIVMMFVALAYTFEPFQLMSAIARKTALASAGLVFYYVSRYFKIGIIDWDEEWRKKYAIAILFYTAIVFAFG